MTTISILVMDDKSENLDRARAQFKNKNVKLICTAFFSAAKRLLKKYQFDVVLSDLMLPGESEGTGTDVGKDTPYGLVLSILARNMGVPHVAIITDGSHHDGPIPYAMDTLLGVNPFLSVFNEYEKNWLRAAERFVSIEDLPDNNDNISTKKSLLLAGSYKEARDKFAETIKDYFDVTVVGEKNMDDLTCIFSEINPDSILLFGEVSGNEKASGNNHDIKNIFDKLILAKNPRQKIYATGFVPIDNPGFIDLLSLKLETLENIVKKLS